MKLKIHKQKRVLQTEKQDTRARHAPPPPPPPHLVHGAGPHGHESRVRIQSEDAVPLRVAQVQVALQVAQAEQPLDVRPDDLLRARSRTARVLFGRHRRVAAGTPVLLLLLVVVVVLLLQAFHMFRVCGRRCRHRRRRQRDDAV